MRFIQISSEPNATIASGTRKRPSTKWRLAELVARESISRTTAGTASQSAKQPIAISTRRSAATTRSMTRVPGVTTAIARPPTSTSYRCPRVRPPEDQGPEHPDEVDSDDVERHRFGRGGADPHRTARRSVAEVAAD